MSAHKPFTILFLLSVLAFAVANGLLFIIYKNIFVTESLIACSMVIVNFIAKGWIENWAIGKDKEKFLTVLLSLNSARFLILIFLLVVLAKQEHLFKQAIFFAFMIAYLFLFIYHIANLNAGIKKFKIQGTK